MVLDLVATGSNTIIRGYGLTGSDLVVWGGCDASIGQCDDIGEGILNDGVGYDPARDRWRELAGSPLATGVHPQAVWTGNEMLVYAGTASPEAGPTVAAYNSATDSWRALTNAPLAPRRYATASWTRAVFRAVGWEHAW